MNRSALVVFVKRPRPGSVKTRLCPPLRHEEAAALYKGFLLDLFSALGTVRAVDVWIFHAFPSDRSYFGRMVPRGFQLMGQRGADLGARLHRAFQALFEAGYERVAIVGSDHPLLEAKHVRAAFRGLAGRDVVLGPAQDGGYYLIGLRQPHPELFGGMPWSTSRVWDFTMRRVRRRGLTCRVLPATLDIDRPDDLAVLARLLRRSAAVRRRLPQTWGVVRNMRSLSS